MSATAKGVRRRQKRSKRMFTVEEDEQIRKMVEIHGDKEWRIVASALPGRSMRQCRERWRNYLSPAVRSIPWTPEDDQKLEELTIKYGSQWARIAGFFQYRSDVNVKNRWVLLKRNEKRFVVHETQHEERRSAPNIGEQKTSLIDFWGADVWDQTEDYECMGRDASAQGRDGQSLQNV